MNSDYNEWYANHRKKVEAFWGNANVRDEDKLSYLVGLIQDARNENDRDQIELLVDAAFEIENESTRVSVLNNLLLIDGHHGHQEITKELQDIGHPSTVAFIEKALKLGFSRFKYTCSEPEVIAKWFSHALVSIGTKEAIALIEEYANSSDEGISSEMKYRLDKIK